MRRRIDFLIHPKDEQELLNFICSQSDLELIRENLIDKPSSTNDYVLGQPLLLSNEIIYIHNKKISPSIAYEYIKSRKRYVIKHSQDFIQLVRSTLKNNILTSGCLAIATDDLMGKKLGGENEKMAITDYLLICNWLKKHCVNNFYAFNIKNPSQKQPSNTMWIGNHAKEWFTEDNSHKLNYLASKIYYSS